MKTNIEIAEQAARLVDRTINNELPTVSCPEKMSHVMWKRQETLRLVMEKLQQQTSVSTGPKMIK